MSGSVTRRFFRGDFSLCSSCAVHVQVLFVSALEGQGVEDLRALLCGRQMLISCTQIVKVDEGGWKWRCRTWSKLIHVAAKAQAFWWEIVAWASRTCWTDWARQVNDMTICDPITRLARLTRFTRLAASPCPFEAVVRVKLQWQLATSARSGESEMILTDAEADGETADAAEAEVRKTCDNHHDIASDLGLGDRLSACSTACSTGRGIVYPVGATLPISLILQAGLHGQTANGKPGLSADFFLIFVRSTTLQHLGCEARRTQGPRQNATN